MCAWTIDVNRKKQNGGFYLYQHSRCRSSTGNLRVYMSTLRNSFRRKKRRSAQELEICPVGSIYIQVYYRCIGYLSWSVLPCYVILRDVLFLNFELEGNLIFYLLVYKAEIVWCICMSAVSQCVIGYNIHVVIFTCRCRCDVIITFVNSGLSSRGYRYMHTQCNSVYKVVLWLYSHKYSSYLNMVSV